jgi:hypothetical protein
MEEGRQSQLHKLGRIISKNRFYICFKMLVFFIFHLRVFLGFSSNFDLDDGHL